MARKKSAIGLDIGSSSVKLLELEPTKNGSFRLLHFGVESLPPEAIVDGAVMNSNAVVDAIRELVRRMRVRTREVVASVSGHSVIIKRINLPVMTREELEESIQWEAEQYIPFDVKDVHIDVQILDRVGDEAGQMEVLLVAARKELVHEYVSLIHEAGLVPAVIDVDAFAVQNAFELNYDLPSESVALVNIGANTTNICVLHNGISAFTRDITLGGRQVTDEIQRVLNVSFEEAEAMKVGRDDRDASAVVPEEVERVIRTASESIASEVNRSLEFYHTTATGEGFSHIFLSGGGALTPGLAAALLRQAGNRVEIVDPFRRIEIDERTFNPRFLQDTAPQATVAVGLALRRPGDQ
ncbi:MAG: type IV pilus assembly protein PilM [Deltaproteobacteria bacterium]|nr:type IV pilus assembly protein PilM [Deltaproteobacteria bacterium]